MSAPAVLVFVVAAQQTHLPVNEATFQAASQALGGQVSVVEGGTEDDSLIAVGAREKAAVATVRWDPGGARATIHFHAAAEGAHWVDRTILFESDDEPNERGRALGFTLASMLPQAFTTQQPATAQKEREKRWVGAIDGSGVGAFAVDNYGTGVGAQLGLTLYFNRFLGVRGGGGIRFGDVQPAQATAFYVNTTLGLTVRLLVPRPTQRFGVTMRTDFIVHYQSLTHLSADDPTANRKDRWVPGVGLTLEGSVDLAPQAAVVLGLGADAAFGTTSVYVSGGQVAQLSPLLPVVTLGVLARF